MKMESQIRLISIDDIIPNRFQPRLQFDENGLAELAASIQEHGIIQPLVLRRVADKYEIIAGERRYKAAQLAGLTSVPAIISDLDDNESAEVAIIENTQRRNLSAIEEAKSYKKLLDRRYVTQDQLAKRLGTSQSAVANKLRLLSLDETVQDALINEKISERHARSLLKVTDKFKQVELLNKIINERWTVKRLDEEIDGVVHSYGNTANTGGINTNGKIDVNIDDIMNNATDIEVASGQPYTYNARVESTPVSNKKNSLFFNNLENEAANMDPTLNFGFNPFKTTGVNTNDFASDNDYDLLELEDDDDNQEKEEKKIVEQVVVEEKIETTKDLIEAINKLMTKAKTNGLPVEVETFDFDELNQFIIRIDKENR